MPKAAKSGRPRGSNTPDLLLYNYESKRIIGKRQSLYLDALHTCRGLFPEISVDKTITLNTKDLLLCQNEMAVISEDSWENVVGQLKSVWVKVEETTAMAVENPEDTNSTDNNPTQNYQMALHVTYYSKEPLMAKVFSGTRISKLINAVAVHWQEDPIDIGLFYHGKLMLKDQTIADYRMEDGDEIECMNIHGY